MKEDEMKSKNKEDKKSKENVRDKVTLGFKFIF